MFGFFLVSITYLPNIIIKYFAIFGIKGNENNFPIKKIYKLHYRNV